MIEKEFVQKKINRASLEEYLEEELAAANYSHIDFTKTSTSTKITLYSEKPGLVIGRGGHRIKELTEKLKNDFGIENPQVEVSEVDNPDTDARIVAHNVKDWLEKGGHPKRVGNTYARRVREAGAAGVQIEISGKLGGSRGRNEKFTSGYVKKCGETALDNVDYAYTKAVTQPGALGVKVSIMKEIPDYMKRQKVEFEEKVEDEAKEDQEEIEEAEEDADEKVEEAPEEEESKSEENETEESTDAEGFDYEALSDENITDIKEIFKKEDLDPAKVLEVEKDNKDRKTLKKWLETRIDE